MTDNIVANQDLKEISRHAQAAGFRVKTFITKDLDSKITSGDITPIVKLLYTMADRAAGHTPVTSFSYAYMNGSQPERLDLCAVMIPGSEPRIIISHINSERL